MKLALAQINARLGDLDGICARLEQQVQLAGEAGADLLCLPAPLFTGTNPSSLVAYPNFEHDLLLHLQQVATAIEPCGMTCVVPVVLQLEQGMLFEAMLLRRGNVVPLRLTMIRHHNDIPVSPWAPPIFEVAGVRVALSYDVQRDLPQIPHGVDLVIYFDVNSFDASDVFTTNVAAVNEGHFSSEVKRAGMWMACMAPVGAFEDCVFTGGSFVMDDSGRVVAQAPCFEENLLVQDIQRGMPVEALPAHTLPSYQKELWTWEALRLYVRDAVEASGHARVCVPMYGDLPSSLLAVLAVDALGSRKVFGLVLEHEDVQTPQEEAAKTEAASMVRELAERLHIRLIERTIPSSSSLFDRDEVHGTCASQQHALDMLLLGDTAREQQLLPLLPFTKTDYALRANALAASATLGLAPFGDVFLSDLLHMAKLRNLASAILPDSLMGMLNLKEKMREIIRDAMSELALNEAYVAFAQQFLVAPWPSDIDLALSEHVEHNKTLEDLSLFNTAPEAAALLLMLTRSNEMGRRSLPWPPMISARSFDERAWPVMLAWSDLGLKENERLCAASFADAEFERLENKGDERGEQARSEVFGFLGNLLGLSQEQQEELFSEEGQQRMRSELEDLEGGLRELLQRMAEQGGGEMPEGISFGAMPVTPSSFNLFSLN